MTDLATALLRDVPRFASPDGNLLAEKDVLDTLSRALDPALTERAGEVLERLRKADEYEPLGHDGWEAADLITTLLAQNAALRAERDELSSKLEVERALTDAVHRLAKSAEARIATLTARVEGLTGALEFYAEDGWKDRPLDPPTPEEVEMFGGNILDFPMPEVFFDRGERARAALSTTEATDDPR